MTEENRPQEIPEDELPPLEENAQTTDADLPVNMPQYPNDIRKRVSKAEKKIKKAMQKLNLKEFDGVSRVSIRQGKVCILESTIWVT